MELHSSHQAHGVLHVSIVLLDLLKKEIHLHDHHGEGTATMKIPLVILAASALFAGFIPFQNLSLPTEFHSNHILILLFLLPLFCWLCAEFLSHQLFTGKKMIVPKNLQHHSVACIAQPIISFYIDELYLFITKKIVFNLIGRPAAWIDRNIVDGFMNLLASITQEISCIHQRNSIGKSAGIWTVLFRRHFWFGSAVHLFLEIKIANESLLLIIFPLLLLSEFFSQKD
jgi:NADH-quinone oxidoreductase subunit L